MSAYLQALERAMTEDEVGAALEGLATLSGLPLGEIAPKVVEAMRAVQHEAGGTTADAARSGFRAALIALGVPVYAVDEVELRAIQREA